VAPQLSWDRAGSGEPLLLLHGLGSTRNDFSGLRRQLDSEYLVLAPDLPGTGESSALRKRPTVGVLTDVVETDLDYLGVGGVHVLGNSLGARIALELARRGRARSVVALAPSGLNLPPERLYQGLALAATRIFLRRVRPSVEVVARSSFGRAALLAGLRSRPWRASETEARAAGVGFADSEDFWRLLWWAILADVPAGLQQVDCPVVLAQGTADLLAGGQTPRYLLAIPGAVFRPLLGAGHTPQSDAPKTILRLVREATSRAAHQQPTRPSTSRPGFGPVGPHAARTEPRNLG
jgi:pimeloyl-ACP methyl ester carboxylesterase